MKKFLEVEAQQYQWNNPFDFSVKNTRILVVPGLGRRWYLVKGSSESGARASPKASQKKLEKHLRSTNTTELRSITIGRENKNPNEDSLLL